jgi:hypothetical protein
MAQTADQVVVEIRAVIDQYTQAIKKVADDTKRSMSAVEGAVTKAEATVTKASNNAAAAVDQSSRRRMKAAADAATSEQAAAERSARAISMTADITERSAARIEAASRRRQDMPAVVPGAAAGSGASPTQAAAASGRDMAAENEQKESVGASFVKEAAKGLPDLVKGLVEGQDALHVFMQQGAQLLPVFGIWGSVLGGVVGAIDAVADGLGAFESTADRAKAAQESFNAAVDASRGLYSRAEQDTLDLAKSLSFIERGFVAVAKAKNLQAIDDSAKVLKDLRAETEKSANDIGIAIVNATASTSDPGYAAVLRERFGPLSKELDPIIEKLRDPSLTGEQIAELALRLREAQPGAAALGVDLSKLISQITGLGSATIEQSDNYERLADSQIRLNEANQFWVKVLQDLGFTLPEAIDHVNGLSGALDGYISRLLNLKSISGALPNSINGVVAGLKQENEQMGDTVKSQADYADKQRALARGTAAWDEELRTSGSRVKALFEFTRAFGYEVDNTNKRQRAANQGKTTAEEDLKNLQGQAAALDGTKAASQRVAAEQRATTAANAAYNKSLAETGDEKKAAEIKSATYAAQLAIETKNQQAAGSARVSAGAKQDAAIDKSNLKTQQQIDLNTRLIAVYAQGNAARQRAKAQYGAENEARNLKIQPTDPRYAPFIQQRTDEADRLQRSNSTLDDYAKGAELTKASMTAQEAYNASLIELNRLHAEGAITTETYDRQLAKLNADHQGYVEGIQAVGQAIQTGIEGATSFGDALTKVGLALAKLILQAAAFGGDGGGPLGKLFDSLTGVSGGLIGNLIGGGGSSGFTKVIGAADFATSLAGIGRAGGGQALPGQIYQVGETGREWFAPSVPGQVIPNSVIKNAAGGGGGGSGPPIQFNISMAGANGDRTIAEIATAAVKKGLQSVPEINRQHRIRFA